MILTALLFLPSKLIDLFKNIFPVGTYSSDFSSAFSVAGSYLKMFDSFIPVSTLLTVIGILISVELIILASKFLRWLLGFLPFVGGKGL